MALRVLIQRESNGQSDKGLLGTLSMAGAEWEFKCLTLELPDRGNQPNISCIPAGTYSAHRRQGSKGNRWYLHDVEDRSGIMIHAGNWAGDKSAGFKSDTRGCILIGLGHIMRDAQIMLTQSSAAIAAFEAICSQVDTSLSVTIRDYKP